MSTFAPTRSLAENLASDNRALRYAWYAFLAVAGTVILAIAARTKVVLGPVDMSMQTLAIFLIAATFGMRLGVATLLLYMAEGLYGLPVFQSSPEKGIGLAYMMGPTGGYLVGFVIAAAVVGWAADRGWDRNPFKLFGAVLSAEFAIVLLGFAWLSVLIGADKAWQFGVVPFVASDLIKVALASAIVPALWGVLRKVRG